MCRFKYLGGINHSNRVLIFFSYWWWWCRCCLFTSQIDKLISWSIADVYLAGNHGLGWRRSDGTDDVIISIATIGEEDIVRHCVLYTLSWTVANQIKLRLCNMLCSGDINSGKQSIIYLFMHTKINQFAMYQYILIQSMTKVRTHFPW